MSQEAEVDNSRRAFITGHWNAKPVITAACLNRQGVFCQSCKDSCGEQAIVFSHADMGMQMPEIVVDRCTACRDCVSSCPVNAVIID